MPQPSAGSASRAYRPLWWLLGVLLLCGALAIGLSAWLHSRVEDALRQRGLEAEIGRLWFSLPRLALQLRDVRVRNREGRGLEAEQLVLNYGWLELLRGRLHLQDAELSGIDMDLTSTVSAGGRRWEVAGWLIGGDGDEDGNGDSRASGQSLEQDLNLHLGIGRLRIRDSRLCYLDRPLWQAPSCLTFSDLTARDWSLSLQRSGGGPLALRVGAGGLDLRQLAVRHQGGARAHTVVARLVLQEGLFALPGNHLSIDELALRGFGSCPPARWAQVLPVIGQLVGHCASARQLSLAGDVQASFGEGAAVAWQRAQGQGVQLRYAGSRGHNWRAETIQLREARFIHSEHRLRWSQAGATGFDWCPERLRDSRHHLCLRAGSLSLPEPVAFDWRGNLTVAAGAARLQQTELQDLTGQIRDPLTLHDIRLASLDYAERRLTLAELQLQSASGCVPGGLWRLPDHCLRIAGLRGERELQVQFADEESALPWGFASGPLAIDRLRLAQADGGGKTAAQPLQLRKLHWQQLRALGGPASAAEPLLLQDPQLLSLQGCVPAALLAERLRPLCAELESLQGRGSFAWSGGEQGYLIFGDLQLQRLLLGAGQLPESGRANRTGGSAGGAGDGRGGAEAGGGLLVQQLALGSGFLRPQAGGGSGASAGSMRSAGGVPVNNDQDGLEKGQLPQRSPAQAQLAGAGAAAPLPDLSAPNLYLSSLALRAVDGCLPPGWAQLLYPQPQIVPGCFDLRGLVIAAPLRLVWREGFGFEAGALALERLGIGGADGSSLLELEQLDLPDGRLQVARDGRRLHLSLPGLSLRRLDGCLPLSQSAASVLLSPLFVRCVAVADLQLGPAASLSKTQRRLALQLHSAELARLQLTGLGESAALELRDFVAGQVRVDWPGPPAAAGALQLRGLKLANLSACLPVEKPASTGQGGQGTVALPRCLDIRHLHSTADTGSLVAGPVSLSSAPAAAPLWRAQTVIFGRPAVTADTVQLDAVRLEGVRVCGLDALLGGKAPLPANSAGGCVTWPWLQLAAGSRIMFTADGPSVRLAALETAPLILGDGRHPALAFESLGWSRLNWDGGARLALADFALRGLRACRLNDDAKPRCVFLRELALPGAESFSVSGPFSVSGNIRLKGLGFGPAGADAKAAGASVSMRGAVYRGSGAGSGNETGGGAGTAMEDAVGELAEISGCVPAGWLGGDRLAPCYEIGRVELKGIERVQTDAGTVTELVGLAIDGLSLRQPPEAGLSRQAAGLSAELLQLQHAAVARLAFGGGRVAFSGLSLQGVAGCLPPGDVERPNHCLNLGDLTASGSVHTGRDLLQLARLELSDLQLLSDDGQRLLQTEAALLQQLALERGRLTLGELRVRGFGLFGRGEDAPEYQRHTWQLESGDALIQRLVVDIDGRQLDLQHASFSEPRIILARDAQGNFTLRKSLGDLFAESRNPSAKAAEKAIRAAHERRPFRYRLGELYVDNGRFTWIDRQNLMRARLPIRQINVVVRGASNHPADPPAEILLGGHPGGFGEVHMAGELDYLATEKWDAQLIGYLANANLIPAQPYIAELLGYKILQGQLDSRFNIEVRANEVDALAHIRLNKIRLRRLRNSDQLPVEPPLIPLDIALLLMEDRHRNVNFLLPVSGDLYDPTFSFSYIFSDLLQKAIMESLFAYFTPVGVYILASRAWNRFRTLVYLNPIDFAPGSFALTAESRRQLDEVVATLEKKPQTRPGICGIANARDWMALYPDSTPGMRGSRRVRERFYRNPPAEIYWKMQELAHKRGRQVERYLLEQGISANEFIQCAPDYDGSDFKTPRVEFSQ
ncbi:hypothetical protein Maes01_00782 [Microbulbifer aestuariivivens]|uniref:DUF748 domain-containing protein n=1 Tax=Microbulbifer aestuariivivens TaxID=1908308 RepID=A0ABP9WPK1_9GAMM